MAIGYDGTLDAGIVAAVHSGTAYKNLALNPNGGNVGIGTTGPVTGLDVAGDVKANNIELGSAWSRVNWNLYWNGTGWNNRATGYGAQMQLTDTGRLDFLTYNSVAAGAASTGQAYRLTILNNGNVGIGTTSPTAKLHVNSSGANVIYSQGGGIIAQLGADGSTQGNTGTYSNHPFALITNNIERMRVDTSGNVGIGTTAPVRPLHVDSGANHSVIKMTNTNSGATSADGFDLFYEASGAGAFIYNRENSAMLFGTNNLERMRILANGNVGIGTATPDAGLDVNGLIIGGFGASSTAGTLDWNHATNARPGSGLTLLYATATNGPGGGAYYYHPFSFEFNTKDGTGNMTQLAVSYADSATSLNNGAMFIRGRYAGTWTGWHKFTTAAVSDYRAKEDVRPLLGGLDEVMQMRPVRFKYKEGKGPEGDQEGFIAHELQAVAPYSVTGLKDSVDSAGNPQLQSIDLAKLTPLLAAAIQDLKAANDNLKTDNAELRNALDELRGRVEKLEYGK